ncbi:hypothetical protein GN244_ATG13403 [Phytophthora infestans]|uniref:Ty3 transposon capsid-like protein domain-containing protein n=1 Tax=Phytophthora infestans TaxID=4787 RepID=A0A833SL56_PHYIN|nr:hypothetical protein GN244_ATG13403 [Phytophthora infestans]
MLQHQVLLQQQVLHAHVSAQKPQKRKGTPPQFNGQSSDDLELWLFSSEQYYSHYSEEMQTGYRDFKISLGDQPATWTIFKQRIRERFRDADFQHKMLSRLHNLRWSGSQQANTTKFLHLLSQLDCELPEVVKRWYYQQNLRSDTSAFVSQNVPSTLKEVIELAQRFEDFRATIPGPSVQRDQRGHTEAVCFKKKADAKVST